jgi:HAD hydrolase, family IA, variant 1
VIYLDEIENDETINTSLILFVTKYFYTIMYFDKLNRFKYISFDVFDTLLFRKVKTPVGLFEFIQQQAENKGFSYPNYCSARIEAEKKAIKHNSDSDEITLDSIYKEMEFNNEAERNYFMSLEQDSELYLCIPNEEMVLLLNQLKSKGKVIIITSDMYLPTSLISRMLEKCGVCYDYLYVSSEYGIRKSSGKLFKKILVDLHIKRNELIHIGDNWKSDYIMPKLVRMSSIYYKRK